MAQSILFAWIGVTLARRWLQLRWSTRSSRTSAFGTKITVGWALFYRSKHELVFVFKVGTAPHLNAIELGGSGRYRTNVWDYRGVNTFRPGRLDDLAMHPTVKT